MNKHEALKAAIDVVKDEEALSVLTAMYRDQLIEYEENSIRELLQYMVNVHVAQGDCIDGKDIPLIQ